MHCCAITPEGLVVGCVLLCRVGRLYRVKLASASLRHPYLCLDPDTDCCTAARSEHQQLTSATISEALSNFCGCRNPTSGCHVYDCAAPNLLPYGFVSPSRVFAVAGQHCNKGIVVKYDELTTLYEVLDPSTGQHTHVVLGLLDLKPPLSAMPLTPLPVGCRVMARRRMVAEPAEGIIEHVGYDVTYTLRYADGVVEKGVLHNDISLISKMNADEFSVRRDVAFAMEGQHRGVIVGGLGNNTYRVMSSEPPHTVHTVDIRYIMTCSEVLEGALTSPPVIRDLFVALDTSNCGSVLWVDVKAMIVTKFPCYDHPFTERQVQGALAELLTCNGKRKSNRSVLVRSGCVADDPEFRLSFEDFEFVCLRLLNAV